MKESLIKSLFVTIAVLAFAYAIGPVGYFVNQNRAVNALEKAGYSEVKVVDRALFFIVIRGGGTGDAVRFTCKARNPAGKEVTDIYVFAGWPFKGTTIRTD